MGARRRLDWANGAVYELQERRETGGAMEGPHHGGRAALRRQRGTPHAQSTSADLPSLARDVAELRACIEAQGRELVSLGERLDRLERVMEATQSSTPPVANGRRKRGLGRGLDALIPGVTPDQGRIPAPLPGAILDALRAKPNHRTS